MRVPHALGIYRDGIFADFEIVGGLERYVDDTCRGAKEVGILASLVEGEGSTYTSVNFPSLLFIDRIFGIDEGGILLVLIVARAVSTEDDGGPTQGKRKFEVLPSDISRVEADESEFDAPTENMPTIMPLLYQSGYITIKDYDKEFNYYTLDVPNKEVKVGLTKALIPSYVTPNTLATTNTARRIAQSLAKQDMEGALQLLKTYLGTVPYCNDTHYEGHYQQVLYIIFSLLTDYLVDVEVHTPHGRVDIVMLSRTNLYIIEVKMNKDAQTAMQQIDLKDYRQRFALCGKPVVKVGINFDSDKGNIEDWRIE